MSALGNIVSQISSAAIGGNIKPQGFDLNDDTFEKLLMKASEVSPVNEIDNRFSNLGVPAGFQIELLGETNSTPAIEFNPQDIEIKDLNVSENSFSGLMDRNPNLINFAKIHAANAYNIFSKNFVDTLSEFVSDTASILK